MLPADICRCEGVNCDMRGQCARYVDMMRVTYNDGTPVDLVWTARRLCDYEEYEHFIPAEEVL